MPKRTSFTGWEGKWKSGRKKSSLEVGEALADRPEEPAPAAAVGAERGRSLFHGSVGRRPVATLEWVRVLDLRPPPSQPVCRKVEAPRERRVDRKRVRGGAFVVHQAPNR